MVYPALVHQSHTLKNDICLVLKGRNLNLHRELRRIAQVLVICLQSHQLELEFLGLQPKWECLSLKAHQILVALFCNLEIDHQLVS